MAASGAVSAQYGAPCATCGAAPYEPCRNPPDAACDRHPRRTTSHGPHHNHPGDFRTGALALAAAIRRGTASLQ
jgi:hypothetical protein